MPARGESIEEQKLTGISAETKSEGKGIHFSDVNTGGNGEPRLAAAAVPNTMVDNFSLNQVRPVDETTMKASTTLDNRSFRTRRAKVHWRVQVVRTLDHWALQVFLFACLFVALFTVDVVALTSGPDSVDDPVNGLLVGVLIVFAMEIILNTICRDKYVWSFFFWMDIVGTLSILTDVSWIAGGWLETDDTDARAGRLKNASKIARLVRLVRVVRVVKLLTYMEKLNARRNGEVDEVKGAPTSLGKNLSESVSRQVAALVLLTVLVAPLLIYDETDQSVSAYLNVFELNVGKSKAELQPMVDDYFDFINADVKAVVLRIGEHTWDLREEGLRKDFTKRSEMLLQEGICPPGYRSGNSDKDQELAMRMGWSTGYACQEVQGRGIFSSPVHADGVVYVGSEDQHLYAVSAQNGTVFWKLPVAGKVSSSAAIAADGTLYFASSVGTLHAVKP